MRIYGERYSFYQWDLNQKITSPKLKEGDEVHFGSSVTGEALTVEAYRLGAAVVADVPNVLLQQTQKILAYRFVTDGESRLTVCKSTFDVKARPKPADYVYTETECATVKGYVYKALQEAKERGEFNGKDGKDADVSQLVPRMVALGDTLAEEYLGNKYHRLYCERNKTDLDGDGEIDERGTYARICVTEIPIPPPDPDIYSEDEDPALLEAYNKKQYGEHISLNSIPLRTKQGDLRVPARTIEEAEALDPSNAREFAPSISGAKKAFVPKLSIEDGDSNRYAYTVTKNSKGEMAVQLIKMGANPTADVNQPLIRRRTNGAVGTLKNPQADDDAASKYYVDILGDAILAGLDSIIAAQNELLGG